nr:hypothetical protein [Acetobacter persici]
MSRKPGRPPAQSDLLGAPPGHETVAADRKTKARRTARAAQPRSEGVKKTGTPFAGRPVYQPATATPAPTPHTV